MCTADVITAHSDSIDDGEVMSAEPSPVRDGFYDLSPGRTCQCNAIQTGMRRGSRKRKKSPRRGKKAKAQK